MLTGCQKAKNTGRQTGRQKNFSAQLSKQEFIMLAGCHKTKKTGRPTERLFSLVIKTKVVHNVNRMSESQKDRPTDRKTDGRQKDRQTEKQIERQKDFSAQLAK